MLPPCCTPSAAPHSFALSRPVQRSSLGQQRAFCTLKRKKKGRGFFLGQYGSERGAHSSCLWQELINVIRKFALCSPICKDVDSTTFSPLLSHLPFSSLSRPVRAFLLTEALHGGGTRRPAQRPKPDANCSLALSKAVGAEGTPWWPLTPALTPGLDLNFRKEK